MAEHLNEDAALPFPLDVAEGVIATSVGIGVPWNSLVYFRNRFFPTSEISDTFVGVNTPPLTVPTTFPLSALTEISIVVGPICEVTAAAQSPMNGAACAGETVDPVDCHANSTGAPGARPAAGTLATKATSRMVRSVRHGARRGMGHLAGIVPLGALFVLQGTHRIDPAAAETGDSCYQPEVTSTDCSSP